MTVVNELFQGLVGIVFAFGVIIVLNAVHLDAAIVLRKGKVMLPSLLVGLDGIDDPGFVDKMRWVKVGDDGKPGWCHLPCCDKATAAHKVLLTPVAAFASRREALDGFSVINALPHG